MIKIKEVNSNINIFDYLGNWINDVESLNKQFINNKPYPYIVIENFFKQDIADQITNNYPKIDNIWHKYYNPFEYKYTLDDLDKMPSNISDIFNLLSTDNFIDILKKITGISDLTYDPYLHGAGLHTMPSFGRLNVHLDYEKHPITGKERRLNLIYFTNKDWKEEYNGDLQLWEKNMSNCSKKIYPKFNCAVIFRTNDVSWHGIPDKIMCPENMYRQTIAYYWVSELSTKKIESMYRLKAKYVKRPFEKNDDRLTKLFDIRVNRRITTEDINEIWPDWNEFDY